MTHHEISTDFVVAGGGMSGVCAALAAARNGAKVVIVQDRSVLGGNASGEIRMHIVGADNHGTRPGARESGIIEELRLEEAAANPQRSYSQWDLLLYDKVVCEPNITLLLDTVCEGCETAANADGSRRIVSVRAARASTEDVFTLRAPLFADCTGDGRLGFEAGADHAVGREAKGEFGESLALDKADRQTLGSSVMFTARKHAAPQPFRAPDWARRFERREFSQRPISRGRYEYGFWWSEWGGQLDTLKDNAHIRHELFRIALGVWDYVKNSGDYPDSANWALDWVGMIPGKRESRRFFGPHILTQHDIERGRLFEDGVAYGGWPLDLHPPSGIDATDEAPCAQHEVPWLYTIPLRALYSRNVGNLFFAGRNISATHVGLSSTRVMATCSVIGQAIGTAAARMKSASAATIASAFGPKEIGALRQHLLRDDAFIPGARNEDPDDKARAAGVRVSASGETAGSEAANVTDGVTRELFSHLGAWADGRTHRWESAALPAWIELEWPEAQEISEVHLTFDSGLQRELILSLSDSQTANVIRGPQPEVVRDYELLCDGRVVAAERGNVLRKRVHRLEKTVRAKTLRLAVSATNGSPTARVFEVRVY